MLVPKGKVALGKMAATLVHGARMLEVDGNFDASLDVARDLADRFPVTLVNSVNPFRLEGQKTAAFEICDALGRAPDIHCVPVGNAGNISSHWMGYSEYLLDGVIAEPPQLFGFQAAGAAPHRARGAGRGPADDRDRDPDREPGLVGQGGGRRDRIRGRDRLRHRPARSWPPIAGWRARGCSSSRPAPRASPGMLQMHDGWSAARGTHGRVHPDGTRLEGPEWAIAGAAPPATVPADADAVAAQLGL